MFGWRARIGFISPGTSGIHTSAIEMEMLAPDGVLIVSRSLDGPSSLSPEDLRAVFPQIGPAARELTKKTKFDVVVMGGAPICLANGPDKLTALLAEVTGVPATTTVTGLVNGIHRLGLQKAVVVMPYYKPDIVALVREFLTANGVEIVSMVNGDIEFGKHENLSQQGTYRMAKEAFLKAPPADGLVIVGGGTPIHEVIGVLEQDIGKPVVANNFASLWNALQLANVRQPIHGYGSLLTLV